MISLLFTFIILGLVVWILLFPDPIKKVLNYAYPSVPYEVNENAKVTDEYTLYSNKDSPADKLVVVFIGGSGIFSNVSTVYGFTNHLNTALGVEYDILTFPYPVRFKYTVHDTLVHITNLLRNFLHYNEYHAIGISYGAMLFGGFYQKESNADIAREMQVDRIGINFRSFTGISGIYSSQFNISLLTKMFHFYILRKTPGNKYYSCYGIRDISVFVISSLSDFLLSQTINFLNSEHPESYIYRTKKLPHNFPQLLNLPEATDCIDRVVKHIKGNSEVKQPSVNA